MNQLEIKKAQRVIYLITTDQKGGLSEVERKELKSWVDLSPENLNLLNELKNSVQKNKALEMMNAYDVNASFRKLKSEMIADSSRNENKLSHFWITAAAAILILISIAGYFYIPFNLENKNSDSLADAKGIAPGSNKAILTLADGSKVELRNDKQSVIMKAGKFTYNDGTNIISTGREKHQQRIKNDNQYTVLATPRGGQYQVVLSDGTKVWLNAASVLKYPDTFEDGKRIVILTGEAYFEVAAHYISPGKKMPFIVKTATQQVEVLGTHFNINGYPDEADIRTTLIEGSVRVLQPQQSSINAQVLKPNQQSIITKATESIKVIQVNPAYVIDWKNGDFIFDTDIRTIMRQISRWYNVEVAYEGDVTEEEFGGRVLRSKNLAEVLKVLQETNKVHFRIEDASSASAIKRVVVTP